MIVADVNVLLYLLIPGQHTAAAEAVWARDGQWALPSVWRSEFLNVLCTYYRNGLLGREDALEAMERAEKLISKVVVSDPSDVVDLAKHSGCAGYDCEYIAVARAMSVRVVTHDQKLIAAFPNDTVSMTQFGAGSRSS